MRPEGLSQLGLTGEDWGGYYLDTYTHAEFSSGWNGTVPCPTEAEIHSAYTATQPPPQLTQLDFMNRFTDEELAGIYTAAKAVVAVEIWLEKFKIANWIETTDLRTIAGVQGLEAGGLIGPGRAAEILG